MDVSFTLEHHEQLSLNSGGDQIDSSVPQPVDTYHMGWITTINPATPLEFSCTCKPRDDSLHLELFPTVGVMSVLKLVLACRRGLDTRVLPRERKLSARAKLLRTLLGAYGRLTAS